MSGVSPDTIGYYERNGLLHCALRSTSGYRLFSPDQVAQVHLIRSALSIGLSVRELAAVLAERNHGGAPCHRVRKLVASKLTALEAQLRELWSWQRELETRSRSGTACWLRVDEATKPDCLEAVAATHPKSRVRNFFLKANGGVIEVAANDSADVASRDEISMHLQHIAQAFQSGDFDIPMFVHAGNGE